MFRVVTQVRAQKETLGFWRATGFDHHLERFFEAPNEGARFERKRSLLFVEHVKNDQPMTTHYEVPPSFFDRFNRCENKTTRRRRGISSTS